MDSLTSRNWLMLILFARCQQCHFLGWNYRTITTCILELSQYVAMSLSVSLPNSGIPLPMSYDLTLPHWTIMLSIYQYSIGIIIIYIHGVSKQTVSVRTLFWDTVYIYLPISMICRNHRCIYTLREETQKWRVNGVTLLREAEKKQKYRSWKKHVT